MMDQQQLGRRIQERRKAQGFTQEQLGNLLGVSAQAVSKWENGESAPDIGLLPSLCQALGVASDALLGIDGGAGLESLAEQLVARLAQQKGAAREAALFGIYTKLHFLGQEAHRRPEVSSSSFVDEESWGVRYWQQNGFIAASFPGAVTGKFDPESLAAAQLLLQHWAVASCLIKGPKGEAALREQMERPEALPSIMGELMDAGLVIRDKRGYSLDPKMGLVWSVVFGAILNRPEGFMMVIRCETRNKPWKEGESFGRDA
jgi:transcriptional regulator with XRE-family HTH domain